tara:strand:- start:241 stop:594 length:354 start_codon:yes stop_codon:yes gene_type:complete
MVGSRTHQHTIARAFGSTPNGSLPAYGAVGEMSQYQQNPRAHLKYKKVTALGETQGLTTALGGAGLISLGLIWFGMGFPGYKPAADWAKKRLEDKRQTAEYAAILIGGYGLVSRAYK